MSKNSFSPIDPSEAASWDNWKGGPPESKLHPVTGLARWMLPIAQHWPWRGYGKIIAGCARLFGGPKITLTTNWGGRYESAWNDRYFLRGTCSEPFETAVLIRLVEPGMSILDIGANRGWYTILFSKFVGPAGRVVAFEPDQRARKALQRNVEINNSGNVEIIAAAAADQDGTLSFVNSPESLVSHLKSTADDDHGESVKSIHLSNFIAKQGLHIDLVKCDVEGAEASVVKGLLPALDGGMRPIMLIESIERNMAKYDTCVQDMMRLIDDAVPGAYRYFLMESRLGRLVEYSGGEVSESAKNLLLLPADSAQRLMLELQRN